MNVLFAPFSEYNALALTIVELVIVLFMAMYTIFAVVIIKQVNLMFRTLQIGLEEQIKFVAYTHFAISVGVLLFSIFILLT